MAKQRKKKVIRQAQYGEFDLKESKMSPEDVRDIFQDKLGPGLPEGHQFATSSEVDGMEEDNHVVLAKEEEGKLKKVCKIAKKTERKGWSVFTKYPKRFDSILPLDKGKRKIIWDPDVKQGPYKPIK